MADIKTDIAGASQDLQTIEDFVNLPADSDVRPRLLPSVNVGTLAGTRQAIFEAGGLPATPFKTKALMTASALANDKYAMVTDDTVNNGLYVKTAGAWVKSGYDPLTQAKSYTDTAKSEAITAAALDATSKSNGVLNTSKSYVNTSTIAKIMPYTSQGINYKTVERTLEITGVVMISTVTTVHVLSTPKILSIPSSGLYRLEFNVETKDLRISAYNAAKSDAWILVAMIRTTSTGMTTNDIIDFSIDGKTPEDAKGNPVRLGEVVARIYSSVNLNLVTKKLEVLGNAHILTEGAQYATPVSSLDLPTTTNSIYRLEYQIKTSSLTFTSSTVSPARDTVTIGYLLINNVGTYKLLGIDIYSIDGVPFTFNGKDGKDGERGLKGDTGATGAKGADGRDGSYTQKAYITYDDMVLKASEIPANTSINVSNDPDSSKNGLYTYDGLTFTKSIYDPIVVAKKYTDDLKNRISIKQMLDSEVGLVRWAEFKKPPYSAQEYTDAYNNGVRIAAFIHKAKSDGATEVIFEANGLYPFIYVNLTGTTNFHNQTEVGSIALNGIKNLVIDFNGSTPFMLFDSDNKHQYNLTPSTYKAWQLCGSLISYVNCRGLTFRNGLLRGDQYTRSFIDTNEKTTEQTYGIRSGANNRDSRFENMKFTGFRGDGLNGTPRGTPLVVNDLYNWFKGGLGVAGEEIDEVGSYRTVKLSIVDKVVIDNRVQLWSWAARLLSFRNSLLKVIFYDVNDVYISQERVGQCEDIYLPKGTASLRFVALDDERTTATVNYTSLDYGIVLGTGMSYGFTIDGRCEFYENHRGGVANLGGGSVFEKGCSFHDSGKMSKLGFPHYGDPTQYAINFEDTYTASLTVDGISVRDTPQGVLGNCRKFVVTNSHFKGIEFGCVNNYSCIIAKTSGNTFEDCGGNNNSATWFLTSDQSQADSYWDISNNNYINSSLAIITTDKPKVFIDVSNNRLNKGRFVFKGYGNNHNSQGNTVRDIGGTGSNVNSLSLKGLGINTNNAVLGNILPSSASFEFEHSSDVASNNLIKLRAGNDQFNRVYSANAGEQVKFNGVTLQSTTTSSANCNFSLNARSVGYESHTDIINISDVIFDNVKCINNGIVTRDYCPSVNNIQNCVFKNSAYVVLSIRETIGTSKSYIIKGVTFDVTNSTKVFENVYALLGTCTVSFIDCKFVSDTPKSIAIIQGVKTGITATAVGCQFINVTNTDGLLQVT